MTEKPRTKRFLIVDDSALSRLMLKAIISETVPEAEIIEAADGKDALDKVQKADGLDISFIDFNMPGMNGLELYQKLNEVCEIPRRALLTANIQDAIREQSEELGVSFLNKPIVEDVIRTFIHKAN